MLVTGKIHRFLSFPLPGFGEEGEEGILAQKKNKAWFVPGSKNIFMYP